MKRNYESPSSLKVYLDCPQKFAFKYRDKLPDPSGPAAILGTAFHEAAYATWEAGTVDTTDALPFMHDEQIMRMLKALYAHPEIKKLPRTFHCPPETSITYDYGTGKMKGIIDLCLTDGSVNDFKTSSKKWTEQKVRENFQHLCYTWLARAANISPATVFRYIVVTTGANPFVQVITIRVSQEFIDNYIQQVKEITGYIDLDLFYPTPGQHCYYCPYKNVCPAFNQPQHVARRIPLEQD